MLKNEKDYGSQVGCVLVDDKNVVIAKSYYSVIGGVRYRAEEIIINNVAKADLKNSTLYVTLEPCYNNHHHNRKHCAEQIVESGIKRVVVGLEKFNGGGGINYLRKNGVEINIIKNDKLQKLSNLLFSGVDKNTGLTAKLLNKIYFTRSKINI